MSLILPLEKQALNLRPLLWLLLPLLVLATLFFWPLSLIVEQALRGANGEIGPRPSARWSTRNALSARC